MTRTSPTPDHSAEGIVTDAELALRTQNLIDAAKDISLELMLQTERLATTIDKFNREVVEPMRRLKGDTTI